MFSHLKTTAIFATIAIATSATAANTTGYERLSTEQQKKLEEFQNSLKAAKTDAKLYEKLVNDGLFSIPKVKGKIQTTRPPAGAEILFNGKEESVTANWVPEKKDAAPWPVKNGIWIDSNGTDMLTKKSYGSVKLHLEWRVPADRECSGQKGANSGVIFSPNGWYEVQILESHDNPDNTYADGVAGAIYQRSIPSSNPSNPKGEWNSYDITYLTPKFDKDGKVLRKPTFTVIYNGVQVQDKVEINGSTLGRGDTLRPHPEKQPIKFQFHNDPIEFRNIWVQEIRD